MCKSENVKQMESPSRVSYGVGFTLTLSLSKWMDIAHVLQAEVSSSQINAESSKQGNTKDSLRRCKESVRVTCLINPLVG